MLVEYEDIEPYLYQLDWTANDTLCGPEGFFVYIKFCRNCPFGTSMHTCKLDMDYNKHLPQLIAQVKLKNPELFV